VINDEPTSPAKHLAHILGLALTNDKFLAVIKRDKPSLTDASINSTALNMIYGLRGHSISPDLPTFVDGAEHTLLL
jgi:hypothetical protein